MSTKSKFPGWVFPTGYVTQEELTEAQKEATETLFEARAIWDKYNAEMEAGRWADHDPVYSAWERYRRADDHALDMVFRWIAQGCKEAR